MKVWVLTCDYGQDDVQMQGIYATPELGMQEVADVDWARQVVDGDELWFTPATPASASDPRYQLSPWEVQGAAPE